MFLTWACSTQLFLSPVGAALSLLVRPRAHPLFTHLLAHSPRSEYLSSGDRPLRIPPYGAFGLLSYLWGLEHVWFDPLNISSCGLPTHDATLRLTEFVDAFISAIWRDHAITLPPGFISPTFFAEILSKELAIFAKTTKSPATETEVVDEEALKALTFDTLFDDIQAHTPQLFDTLSAICAGQRQDRNKLKDSKFCITIFINALANQMSHLNNKLQKLICLCFKAKKAPKSLYHMFQPCGIVASYQWSVKALENLSAAAMDKAVAVFDSQPCLIMYNNIRLPFPVKHQRGDSLSTTDNGTAITMIPLRDSDRARELLWNSALWKENRLQVAGLYRGGRMPYLNDKDVVAMRNFTKEKQRTIDNILGMLFKIPQLAGSLKRDHPVLAKLPPVHQLPVGQEHWTRQYMLETVCQEEASYEGNYALTQEIFRQVRCAESETHENWALRRRVYERPYRTKRFHFQC
ncbi:hypothetical protein FRC12_008664 [Ceratobasidium sp. 428]|nr:hypothetical protein FRC12_008664 [Ceratobasidium sp. 428]